MPAIQTISVSDVASALTMLGALGLFFWRLSVKIKAAVDGQKSNSEALSKLNAHVATLSRKIVQDALKSSEAAGQIRQSVGELRLLLTEREKDVSRLEGRMDEIGGLMLKQVSAVKEATSSLDAVWRTLQVLFPDKVPKRASDRK